MKLDDQQFNAALRSALHYLYEPDQLQRSPLIDLFGLSGRVDAALALQAILLDSIQALQPGDDAPAQSNAWRLYDLLYFRYVRGYERLKVANQLGISDRQLSREQKNAIKTLALYLWKTYQIDQSQPGSPSVQEAGPWVEALPAEKPAPWKPVLRSVIELLHSLARDHEVRVHYDPDEDLPDLLVPHSALRHSLLTVLGCLIPLARRSDLFLIPTLQAQALAISVQVRGQAFAAFCSDPGIDAARMLVEQAGGTLDLVTESSPGEVRLTLPVINQVPVLVIDDNPDTIQLFQRYVQDTRYTVVGLQEPAEALQWMETINPRILVVDVMMPEVDGWDLITQLRLSHRFPHMAVMMCSILPQEDLARSLGADAFLQKPVLPQDFLHMLDRLMDNYSRDPDPP